MVNWLYLSTNEKSKSNELLLIFL